MFIQVQDPSQDLNVIDNLAVSSDVFFPLKILLKDSRNDTDIFYIYV